MHPKVRLLLLAICAALTACGPLRKDRPFHVEAVYQAPKSGYELTVHGDGVVRAGADLAAEPIGLAEIRPLGEYGQPVTIRMETRGQVSSQIAGASREPLHLDFRKPEAGLTSVLERAGYRNLDADEVDETLPAMRGAMFGPKATIVSGQSRFLNVIRVDIE